MKMDDQQRIGMKLATVRQEKPNVLFDVEKCIICQSVDRNKTVTTVNGRKRVQEAAAIRDDIVAKRLKSVASDVVFVYHVTNLCYKTYTLKKSLDKIAAEKDNSEVSESEDDHANEEISRKTRSSVVPREPPSSVVRPTHIRCMVCGHQSHNGVRDKFRISESERAKYFLSAAIYFQDDVYTRVADLESDTQVFGADLLYHKVCLETYFRKYEYAMKNVKNQKTISSKDLAFEKGMEIIVPKLKEGYGFTLTEIRDLVNELAGENIIRNNEVKLRLQRHCEDEISFSSSDSKNESLMVFSSKVGTDEIVKRMRKVDNIKAAAKDIREALQKVDFGLANKFCDSDELKTSWMATEMPDEMLTFLSAFLNINKGLLLSNTMNEEESNTMNEEDSDPDQSEMDTQDDDDECDVEHGATFHNRKMAVSAKVIYQILYYSIHRGMKQTPLHLMVGHTIYDKCKSRELITCMNRALVSVSYNEVLRKRQQLAAYAIQASGNGNTPLPSHFDTDNFTIAAFDNFDHRDASSISGTHDAHDTVSVLFQVCPDRTKLPVKPKVSETNLIQRSHYLQKELPCQRVLHYKCPVSKPWFPESFKVKEGLLCNKAAEKIHAETEFAISFIKHGIPEESTDRIIVPTWAGCRSLISTATPPLMHVGFLPFIPKPVTEHATVFLALKNLQNICSQLKQPALPVFSDEGVFHIIADIMINSPSEFRDIIPMIGNFHCAKVVMHNIGRFLHGSGAKDALIECKVFGVKTAESVMNGTHYVRSLKGLLILEEAILKMKWSAFWKCNTKEKYEITLKHAQKLKLIISNKNVNTSPTEFNELLKSVDVLYKDFQKFSSDCAMKSEMCRYWDTFLYLVNLLKFLIAADRNGDWDSHLQAIQNLLPVFREFDSINYLRYASWYLEKMRWLEEEHPEVYQKFKAGHFVVRQTKRPFSAVSPDMKLEQTIQRSQKSSKGIIGQTRQQMYVTEWELVYHEVLGISNCFREILGADGTGYSEVTLHHELSGNLSTNMFICVNVLCEFMNTRGNPYETSSQTQLHNFISNQCVPREDALRLLKVKEHGQDGYEQFRNDRFVNKTSKLSDVITKAKLPTMERKTIVHTVKSKTTLASQKNSIAAAHRSIDIAKARGETMKGILKYDLLPTSMLLDSNGYTSKPVKHVLLTELEKKLDQTQYCFQQRDVVDTAVIVDFMSQIRQLTTKDMLTFQNIFDKLWTNTSNYKRIKRVDFVFDSYIEQSLKEGERGRRRNADPIELIKIEQESLIPTQMDRFWSSSKNKEMLQLAAATSFIEKAKMTNFTTVISGTITGDNDSRDALIVMNKEVQTCSDLQTFVEEADSRIIIHLFHAVQSGITCLIVLSNDTDVVVLILRYIFELFSNGLQELWIKVGVGDKMRYVPLHTLGRHLGAALCNTLIKAHILTGSDVTSKIGTKPSALKASPETLLLRFAEDNTLSEETLDKAEEYLVKVLHPSSKCKTYDELRYSLHKQKHISELPPSSFSLRNGHIRRCFFVLRECFNLSQSYFPDTSLQLTDYGWCKDANGVLKPDLCLNKMPSELLIQCGCTACATSRCKCKLKYLTCTEYCKCGEQCKR